ncbi:hypothetical protein M9H77_29973 [Catharanthus roseus]|uniref:Uncharacterized protein n=1 Tax=Catharanthus roseus TaxID=4058 RepID=A0ACB9ZZU0_CATRO|nr:hypothetical protein M9H77_29973 [Catharanthus roseus]
MSSKFISRSISHLVANDSEIPVSNVIQEVQVIFQIGCTYKRAWYARKFTIERVFGNWESTFNILPKYLQVMQDSKPGSVYEDYKVTTYNPREGIYMAQSPIRVDVIDNNVYTLRMNNKSCSYSKWQAYVLSCSHALAVCRENGMRADTYVSDIYS